MDFNKFGLVILILGIIILGSGAILFGTNQPKKFDINESEMTIFGRNDLGNWLETENINVERNQKRKQAKIVMIAGGIVLIIGAGMKYSSKSAQSHKSE